MYILECADGSYYTGSTNDIDLRLKQHQAGEGANHTKKRLPVKLVYFEHFQRVDEAFYREKQVQGWSRKKKEALIEGMPEKLHELAKCLNETSHVGFDSAQASENGSAQASENDSAQASENGSAQASEEQTDIERSRNDRLQNNHNTKTKGFTNKLKS